jgi:hypothetical protein
MTSLVRMPRSSVVPRQIKKERRPPHGLACAPAHFGLNECVPTD